MRRPGPGGRSAGGEKGGALSRAVARRIERDDLFAGRGAGGRRFELGNTEIDDDDIFGRVKRHFALAASHRHLPSNDLRHKTGREASIVSKRHKNFATRNSIETFCKPISMGGASHKDIANPARPPRFCW
jgi:hypothetical protein